MPQMMTITPSIARACSGKPWHPRPIMFAGAFTPPACQPTHTTQRAALCPNRCAGSSSCRTQLKSPATRHERKLRRF